MDKHAIWKWLLLIGLVAWSLVLVTPFHEKVKLGLDLQGGSSFVLEVDKSELSADALRDAQERALEIIRNRVDGMGVTEPVIYPEPQSLRIVVQIPGLKAEDRDRALANLRRAAFLEFRMVHPDNDRLVQELFDNGLAPTGYRIVSWEEQLPSGRWITEHLYQRDRSLDPPDTTEQELRERLRTFHAPAGYEFMLRAEVKQGKTFYRPYFVSRRRELTGENLKSAGVDYKQFGEPIVTLKFDAKGARKFAQVTSDYAPGGAKNPSLEGRRYLAIVLDGTLYSAPFIKTPIHGGEAIIEGNFTFAEARDLAIVLRAGSLPVPVNVVEERGVDPTLGRDAVESGKRSALYAGIAVALFMVYYYKWAGVVANLALLLDLVLLPLGMMLVSGFLSLITGGAGAGGGTISLPTLTLPGIAGIVLTLGMAVDANVLIYERIREEQATGKRFVSALSAGYEKAFRTILDANVTTLLTAVILFWQGSGPVRGFAVTLSAGIVVSMYTAVLVTRMLFNLLAENRGLARLNMRAFLGQTAIDFLGYKTPAALLSVTVFVATGAVAFVRGPRNFGVDFTGGKSHTYVFEHRRDVQEIRAALSQAGVREAQIQYQREMLEGQGGASREFLEIRVPFEQGDKAKAAILEKFGADGYRVVKEDAVGPQIGRELQRRAMLATSLALVGILLYLSVRFEFAFAVGAIVALAHDVLITTTVFCALGRQLSLPVVAALLTIVGYSVNDTIVVFDRIREELKLRRGRSYREICNLSINETLPRTLLTSFTTLLSVAVLLVVGGGAIRDFALTLFIGIIVGTYSSVFIATPVTQWWHRDAKPAAD